MGVARQFQAWRAIEERKLRLYYVGSTLGLAWAVVHPLLFVGAYDAPGLHKLMVI